MAALSRESSFERLMSSMQRPYTPSYEAKAAQNEAAHTLSTWLKKSLKLKAVYKSMDSSELSTIQSSLTALSALDSANASFVKAQEILSSESFLQALSHFLNLLPSDPSLKKRNKQARSVRIISSSLLITQFPELVLEDDGKPDLSREATACHLSAKVFKASLKRLVGELLKPSTSLTTFRNYLIGYRFSLRNFLNAIDTWKLIDRDRLKHSFEVAYCESFMVIWSSQKILEKITEQLVTCSESDRPPLQRERDENAAFVAAGKTRLKQFRDMLCKLLGPREGGALLEELDAYLHSSTQAMDVHVEMKSEAPTSTPLHQQSNGQHSYNILGGAESSTSASPNVSSSPPLSPEATQLRRVAMMTGMGENNILHELCLNPKFQLPDPLNPLRPFNSATDGYNPLVHAAEKRDEAHIMQLMKSSSDGGKDVLKNMVIKTIEERFVANMTKSKIKSFSEVEIGGIYPVWYDMPNSTIPNGGLFIFSEIVSIDDGRERFSCRNIVDSVLVDSVAHSRIKLFTHPRDAVSSGFLSFVDDMRARISALIPSRSNMHSELKTAFDLDLLKQMVENDAMTVTDLVGLLSNIVSFVSQLQSPHASSEFIAWFNPFAIYLNSRTDIDEALIYVPKFFEVTTERMEQIQLEMANYYLSTLSSSNFVKNNAVGLFKKTVDDRIVEFVKRESPNTETHLGEVEAHHHYGKFLPRTKEFLSVLVKEPFPVIIDFLKDNNVLLPDEEPSHLSSLGIGSVSGKAKDMALVARSFSILLQQNVDLGKSEGALFLPETFLWDGERLRNLKNEIDSLVLVTTLLISCRSYLLSVKKRLSSDQEVALQSMLYEVMRDSSVTLSEVVTTAQNFVRKSFGDGVASALTAAPLPDGWEKVLEESLKKCVSQSSPVFSLFSKRVYSVLVRALLDVPFTDLLARYSMNSRSQLQQLKVIIQMGKTLFTHNMKAFGDIYSSMLQSLCKDDVSSDPLSPKPL